MPTIPPTAVNKTDEIDKKFAPHKSGMALPTIEPMPINIQMTDFEFIKSIIAKI